MRHRDRSLIKESGGIASGDTFEMKYAKEGEMVHWYDGRMVKDDMKMKPPKSSKEGKMTKNA